MTSSIHAPEAAAFQGLEIPFEGIEHDQDLLQHVPDSWSIHQKEARPSTKHYNVQKSWIASHRYSLIIVILIILLITSATVGGVIGSRGHQRASSRS